MTKQMGAELGQDKLSLICLVLKAFGLGLVHHIYVGQKMTFKNQLEDNLNFLESCFILQILLENKCCWIPASSPVWSEENLKITVGRLPNN